MSSSQYPVEHPHDAITPEEITGDAPPPEQSASRATITNKRANAFTELMSHAKKPKPTSSSQNTNKGVPAPRSSTSKWDPRDGLLEYIQRPEENPEGRVVDYDDDFVVIRDKYPKASVHLLLLPRDPAIYTTHPLHTLSTNTLFLAKIRSRIPSLVSLAASELRRQYGLLSASDAPYQSALEDLMSSPSAPYSPSQTTTPLPPGRDWAREIKAGVHTHPSMNHFHVHVLSREMNSACVKHKKHYLSFQTSFFVGIDEFPLEEGSGRLRPGDWPSWDMVCWRCGRNFGNKFKALKEHLEEEINEWKRE